MRKLWLALCLALTLWIGVALADAPDPPYQSSPLPFPRLCRGCIHRQWLPVVVIGH